MLYLHPLPGDGRFYCGPAAIASFTGLHPKEEVRAAINQVRKRKPTQGIIGMWPWEIVQALKLLGFNAEAESIDSKVKPMLKTFHEENPDFVGIVNVTKHYIAMARDRVQDNQSGGIYHISRFSGQRKRVNAIIRVWK